MAIQKYFLCTQCGKAVKAAPGVYRMACRCDPNGFASAMQEITWDEYLRASAPPKKQPQAASATNYHKGVDRSHWDQIIYDDLFNYTVRQPPKLKVYKCRDCGADTTKASWAFGGSSEALCDACEAKLLARMQKVFAQVATTQRVKWIYCHGCGDLLPEKGVLHRCPMDACPQMTTVEFEENTMTPVTNVRIWWDAPIAAYRLSSPYSKDLVEGLKATIPISDRSFDPTTKVWTFVERQLDPLLKFLKLMNVQPVVVTRQQVEAASQSTPQGPRKGAALAEVALEFIRVAGPDAMLKAYRAAAMTLHPDRGGSMDKMSALNAAWERLQKEVYGQ